MQRVFALLTLCGIVVLVASAPVPAKDETTGSPVDSYVTVISVHEAPATGPLPGIHLEAKVNGRVSDIYLAPVHFLEEYGMTFQKGDDVHITGSRTKVAGMDVVLAREVAIGAANKRTLYLRDDNGPFWVEHAGPGRK